MHFTVLKAVADAGVRRVLIRTKGSRMSMYELPLVVKSANVVRV